MCSTPHGGAKVLQLMRLLIWCMATLVSSQQECSGGGVLCCVNLYEGSRNFYNSQSGKCEAVIRDCPAAKDYDPETNTCIDLASALSSPQQQVGSATSAPTGQQTTSRPQSIGCSPAGSASCGQQACGHGHLDPNSSAHCVCDAGWANNALSFGPKCSTPVLSQSSKVASMNGTSDMGPTSGGASMPPGAGLWMLLTSSQFAASFLIIAAVLFCGATCCCYRCIRRRRKRRKQREAEDAKRRAQGGGFDFFTDFAEPQGMFHPNFPGPLGPVEASWGAYQPQALPFPPAALWLQQRQIGTTYGIPGPQQLPPPITGPLVPTTAARTSHRLRER
mmetsp:Transcript_35504/g.64120  ORF Transcript_35504/g.64120 Transcript_35504/m.64120 type:complete len:333 (+) Transcript_35504:31-1029(+)